jgi:antitoxin component of RelBE/YafQ-DinJ toxin-antitoxin module
LEFVTLFVEKRENHMQKKKTIAIQIRITKEQKEELDIILARKGINQSNLVRFLLDQYIHDNKNLLNITENNR